MSRLRRGRPSPALVVAVMALVAALAGTAIAGPSATTSVSKKKTKKIAKKQANKAVDNLLPIGAEELGELRDESTTITIAAGTSNSGTANCTAEEKVISGGGRFNTEPLAQFAFTQFDYRVGNGWRAGGASANTTEQYTIHAYCLSP